MRAIAAVMAIAVTALASCSSTESPPAPDLPHDVAGRVSADGMYPHLRKLQEIADGNRGSRAEGTPGYNASVDYVVQVLKDRGFDVTTPEFDRLERTEGGNPTLTVSGRGYHVDQASLLVTTPAGGLNAITLRPPKPPGCTVADYGTVSVKGAIAVVDDTGCSVRAKQNTAVAKGAVGLLVVSAPGTGGSPAGLFTPGYYQQLTVPVGVIDKDADAALRRTNAPVRLVLDSKPVMVKTRNVVAQTKTGDTKNVVVAGAHLDSVGRSPGINDNGSGVAALLEAASALGAQPRMANAVRFVFWASETEGPTKYVRGLDTDHQLDDIAMYLSVDMLGSSNAGYFTYDGDQSAQPKPRHSVARRAHRIGRRRADTGWFPQPGRCAARRHAAEQDRRLRSVPGGGCADRRIDHRFIATENRSAGASLGRASRRGVRSVLQHGPRRHRQRRPQGAVGDGSGPRVHPRRLCAVGRWRQRCSAAGPAAPQYALATLITA
jgi:hypothetical protein